MMSVPPVEPLLARPSPTPQPQNTAPMMAAMKGWSLSRWPVYLSVTMPTATVSTITANTVFTQNRHPRILRAMSSRMALMTK